MKQIIKGLALIGIAGSMMGNQSCQQTTAASRELRRRVQMTQMTAPPIILPQGGTFNFQTAANAQMYTVLQSTSAFTTSTIDPLKIYDTTGLSSDESSQFNQCNDQPVVTTSGTLSTKSTISQVAGCMIDMPQGLIKGSILDFTLYNSAGLSLNMAQIPGLPAVGGGFSFEVKSYAMDLAMQAMSPLVAGGIVAGDHKVIAATSKESFQNSFQASLTINFAGFGLGPSYYQQSPLSQVVLDGLTQGVNDLKSQWDAAEPWYAMVIKNCDKYIYINAGNASDVGLKPGDIIRIQNVDYRWQGDACKSQLQSAVDYIGGPVAYATVINVGDNMSTAQIIDKDPNYPYNPNQLIYPGARVYMEQMVGTAPAQASSSSSASSSANQ